MAVLGCCLPGQPRLDLVRVALVRVGVALQGVQLVGGEGAGGRQSGIGVLEDTERELTCTSQVMKQLL